MRSSWCLRYEWWWGFSYLLPHWGWQLILYRFKNGNLTSCACIPNENDAPHVSLVSFPYTFLCWRGATTWKFLQSPLTRMYRRFQWTFQPRLRLTINIVSCQKWQFDQLCLHPKVDQGHVLRDLYQICREKASNTCAVTWSITIKGLLCLYGSLSHNKIVLISDSWVMINIKMIKVPQTLKVTEPKTVYLIFVTKSVMWRNLSTCQIVRWKQLSTWEMWRVGGARWLVVESLWVKSFKRWSLSTSTLNHHTFTTINVKLGTVQCPS